MKKRLRFIAIALSIATQTQDVEASMSFQEFAKQYNLQDVTTEQHHPLTENLSSVFKQDQLKGLECLHKVDQSVVKGFDRFETRYLSRLSQVIYESLSQGGRIFMVGSGSSGRIAIDLSAKWRSFWKEDSKADQVIGLIAGGPRAIVKAKEGFEDSEDEGRKALAVFNPTSKDVVILISASGSAKFNIGFAKEGAAHKAHVYYFHNSETVPPRTQVLFDDYGVGKLLIDTGSQAISGSTRLQAATVAELCLGATFMKTIHQIQGRRGAYDYKTEVEKANQQILSQLSPISKVVTAGIEIFSDHDANFRKIRDENSGAYVTVLGDEHSIREILVDATETAPTFSTNPPRSTLESYKKKAEFRAYLINESDNVRAWKALSGFKGFSESDSQEVCEICVADGALGFGSYGDRPKGKGNLVILALKSKPSSSDLSLLKDIQKQGGKTALIYLSPASDTLFEEEAKVADIVVHLPLGKKDPFGIVKTVALKQTLNMISNGMMLGMNKVIGNRMIDLRLANQKLTYRSIRIIKDLMNRSKLEMSKYSDEELYQMLLTANEYKTSRERDDGMYVPSPVKIVLTQISTESTLEEAVKTLYSNGETIGALQG
ncbi:MAG: SIS domain-containing protein [bacterium]|nr:SIS domain-containing protein [bacterium]